MRAGVSPPDPKCKGKRVGKESRAASALIELKAGWHQSRHLSNYRQAEVFTVAAQAIRGWQKSFRPQINIMKENRLRWMPAKHLAWQLGVGVGGEAEPAQVRQQKRGLCCCCNCAWLFERCHFASCLGLGVGAAHARLSACSQRSRSENVTIRGRHAVVTPPLRTWFLPQAQAPPQLVSAPRWLSLRLVGLPPITSVSLQLLWNLRWE